MTGFFSNVTDKLSGVTNKIKQAQTLLNNRENAEELKRLKDGFVKNLEDGSAFLKKIRSDRNALALADMIGITPHLIKGNQNNVYSHYLKDTISIRAVASTSLFKKHNIQFGFEDAFKGMTEQEIIRDLQENMFFVSAGKFQIIDQAITKSYKATIHQNQWLGNQHIKLIVECNLIEKKLDENSSKFSINVNAKLSNLDNQIGIININEEVELRDNVKFNQTENLFKHVSLPQVVNHYINYNSDNEIVLHFVLA